MKTYFVYILECSDQSFYTGITNNLDRRLSEHNSGYDKSCYTYSRRPVSLLWRETFTDVNGAIQAEKQIKGWSRRKKLALINGNWDDLIRFSRNYTDFGKPEE
ncbi:GIY-YIG nuclease family protein [Salegentibacter sp. JZCK2]|uniref:GIY-YIG nuclease family protein n=1 Tax=Salegentibacter tibetensis TaxID=2873600 RepID=UPI001CCA8FCD|nr:GIY-YIG nuclease family protein [Salegentibacter tibetensis]MBZ9729750.1 GIY-YIG nuclease family protein [Salegentibacter tibetensis]